MYDNCDKNTSLLREKKRRNLTHYMTKALIPTEMSNGQSDNIKTPPKSSITQRLRTDFGRSIAVTTANQLVWLTGIPTQPSHSPQQPCNQKETHLFNDFDNWLNRFAF